MLIKIKNTRFGQCEISHLYCACPLLSFGGGQSIKHGSGLYPLTRSVLFIVYCIRRAVPILYLIKKNNEFPIIGRVFLIKSLAITAKYLPRYMSNSNAGIPAAGKYHFLLKSHLNRSSPNSLGTVYWYFG